MRFDYVVARCVRRHHSFVTSGAFTAMKRNQRGTSTLTKVIRVCSSEAAYNDLSDAISIEKPILHVGLHHPLVGLIDLSDRDHFDVGGDVVRPAEVEHLLRLGDAADRRAGETAASEDETEHRDWQRSCGKVRSEQPAVTRCEIRSALRRPRAGLHDRNGSGAFV